MREEETTGSGRTKAGDPTKERGTHVKQRKTGERAFFADDGKLTEALR